MLPTFVSCQPEKKAMTKLDKEPAVVTIPEGAEVATLGAGCFWCIEAAYNRIDGVISATSGYSGGHVKNPTYEQVCDKTTGHAEVVQVVFDPKKISYERILAWYWDLHDPTTLNRQGNDVGPQYRSVIFYHSPEQKKIAEASKAAAQKNFKDPIVTQIQEATDFYPAENYHQNYYAENKSKNPYCKYVIQPKLQKLHLDD
ncbi:peptide-methionine (S)-S-oxide reductase MsrA [Luteolibacter pohnpeiensis]|uniref:Peptide methionine sulfoxide reductase MsrA n=2 Tax=Luteolibacter pohnpeiensis TaxID=454153 RepID=A0A934S878_9BACT|nr:peptide-methionine (S)-S-oxide reductase MsrA [Luteolibacter pohnpeiensis]